MPRRAKRAPTFEDFFAGIPRVATVILNRAYIGSSNPPPPPPPYTPEDIEFVFRLKEAGLIGPLPPPPPNTPEDQAFAVEPNTDLASAIGSHLIKTILGVIDDETTPGTGTHNSSSTDTTSASATKAQSSELVLEAPIPQSSFSLHPSHPAKMGNSKSSSAKKRNQKKARTSNDLLGNAPAATMTSNNNADTVENTPKSALEVAEQLNAEVAEMLTVNTNTDHPAGNTQNLTPASATKPQDNTLGPHILPQITTEVAKETATDILTSGNSPGTASSTATKASNDTITPANMTKKASKKARQRAKKALAKQNAINASGAAENFNDGNGISSTMLADIDTHTPANVPDIGSTSAAAPVNTTAACDYVPNVDASLYPGFGELDLLLIEQCVDLPQAVLGNHCPAILYHGLVQAKNQAGRDKAWEQWKERQSLSSDPKLAAEISASGAKIEVAKPAADIHQSFSRIPKDARTMLHDFSKTLTEHAPKAEVPTGEEMRAAIMGADNGEWKEEEEVEEAEKLQNVFH